MIPYQVGLTDDLKSYLAVPSTIYFSECSVYFDKDGKPHTRYYSKQKSIKKEEINETSKV